MSDHATRTEAIPITGTPGSTGTPARGSVGELGEFALISAITARLEQGAPVPPGGHRERDQRDSGQRDDEDQTWTTVHVSVRVMPATSWIFAMTSLPSSSTLRASTRAMTS